MSSGRCSRAAPRPRVIEEVRPQVTGIVQSRAFTEGAEVKAGSTLYRLDPATYQTSYDSARAAVAKAEASVQTARRNVARYKELLEIRFISQQAYDDATTTLQQSEADLASAKAAARLSGKDRFGHDVQVDGEAGRAIAIRHFEAARTVQ